MRPLAVVNGVLLGSLSSIFLGLAVVVFIFYVLGTENPALRDELPALWISTLGFGALAAISAWAFVGQLKTTFWRWYAEVVLILALSGMGWYFLV
ncbi:MAG: hypothetical protein V3T39_04130 [Gammaproteobacteria bacterium]